MTYQNMSIRDRKGFLVCRNIVVIVPWRRCGEDALAEQRMGGFLQSDIAKERMDGSQSSIAGASGVPTISFEMIEELTDERRIEILKQDIRGRLICDY